MVTMGIVPIQVLHNNNHHNNDEALSFCINDSDTSEVHGKAKPVPSLSIIDHGAAQSPNSNEATSTLPFSRLVTVMSVTGWCGDNAPLRVTDSSTASYSKQSTRCASTHTGLQQCKLEQ